MLSFNIIICKIPASWPLFIKNLNQLDSNDQQQLNFVKLWAYGNTNTQKIKFAEIYLIYAINTLQRIVNDRTPFAANAKSSQIKCFHLKHLTGTWGNN